MTRLVSFEPGGMLNVEGCGSVRVVGFQRTMIRALLKAHGRVLSYETLATITGAGGDPRNTVTTSICKARRALKEIGCRDMIRTDWRDGYYIDPAAYRLAPSEGCTITLTLPPAMMDALAREAEDGDLEQTALALLGEALEAGE